MIVYYDPNNGNILGLSHKLVSVRQDSYFETDSPIAEQIFLGKEKAIRYYAVVRPDGSYIKQRTQSSIVTQSIKSRVIKFDNNLEKAEVTVIQDVTAKTVQVAIIKSSLEWWKSDSQYSHKKLNIVACKKNNPYLPIWHHDLDPTDLASGSVDIDYTGTDDLTFYTTKLFDSYKHEIKPS